VSHATTLELELYLGQQLNGDASDALERHCDGCDACAAALASEARLELGLRRLFAEQRCGTAADGDFELDAFEPAPVVEAPRPRTGFFLLAAAACAMLALLTARLPGMHSSHPASTPALTTDAGDSLQASPIAPRVWLDGDLAHGTP